MCLVDYRLGGESGIDLARELVGAGSTMPVILLTGHDDSEVDASAASAGATDFLVKGEVSATTLERAIRYAIASHAAARALQDSYRTTVRALAAALDLRDDQTGAHAIRVTALALRLANVVAPELAADQGLEFGFLLHDIGKIGVPDAIVLKPGPLDAEEIEHMNGHVTLGERIVAEVPYLRGIAADIIQSHHERWDGTGYPSGLRGEQIPLAARIFSVVDAFDAITNDRPYRAAQPVEHALREVERAPDRSSIPTSCGCSSSSSTTSSIASRLRSHRHRSKKTPLHVGHPEVDEDADGASRSFVRSDVDRVRPIAEPRRDEHAAPDVVVSLDTEIRTSPTSSPKYGTS